MQGVKTLKTMFPCELRVHLHKSANFKTIFEQIEKYAKLDPTMMETSIQKPSNK